MISYPKSVISALGVLAVVLGVTFTSSLSSGSAPVAFCVAATTASSVGSPALSSTPDELKALASNLKWIASLDPASPGAADLDLAARGDIASLYNAPSRHYAAARTYAALSQVAKACASNLKA